MYKTVIKKSELVETGIGQKEIAKTTSAKINAKTKLMLKSLKENFSLRVTDQSP
jgi:hypothetical protein